MVIEVQPEQNTVPEPSNRSIPDDVPLINDIDMLRSLQEKPGLFSYRACKYLTFIISFHSFQSRLLQMVLFLVLLQWTGVVLFGKTSFLQAELLVYCLVHMFTYKYDTYTRLISLLSWRIAKWNCHLLPRKGFCLKSGDQ